jgi:hypothetical protein
MQKTYLEILPVWVAIDLNGFVTASRFREDPVPIRLQSFSMIKNSVLRVAQDMDVPVGQRRYIAAGLVLASPQRRMKRAYNETQLSQGGWFHVYFTGGGKIYLSRFEDLEVGVFTQVGIGDIDFIPLLNQSILVETVCDFESLGMIRD